MSDHEVDVVVIGGGPVGENVAARAVRGGLTAVMVEAELVGGECSYWACMPSKALLRPGHALAAARRAPGAREAVTGSLDAEAVLASRTSFTSDWSDAGQEQWAEGAGITVVRGHGRLTGERQVEVTAPDGGTQVWTARQAVVVTTGSVPVTPPIPGLDAVTPWGSREATAAKTAPNSLVVIGGGVVAVELAQAWSRLGTKVTLLVRDTVLERFEPFAGERVADGLREDGVDVRTGVGVKRVEKVDVGVAVHLTGGEYVQAEHLLLATGRRPATDDLGLSTVGLDDGATLSTDDSGRVAGVAGGWLYAAGDVTGRAPLTHQGKYAARVVGDVIAARAKGDVGDEVEPWGPFAATADHAAVPQVVFTDPEVASVGLTEQAARDAGHTIRVVEYDLGGVAGSALQAKGYTGRASMVVDEDRGVLLGATLVGQDVAEMIHAATVAVVGEVPLHRLWHAVPSYPTMSEVWLRLLEEYGL